LKFEDMRGDVKFMFCIGGLLAVAIPRLATEPALRNRMIQWDATAVQGVRDSKMEAPMESRALAVVHTCMYDAWAAYDSQAVGTQLSNALRRPASERTEANKQKAISYAAFRALSDLFPEEVESTYKPLMRKLGYDPNDHSTDIETPTGIGNVTCAAVLEYRHPSNLCSQLDRPRTAKPIQRTIRHFWFRRSIPTRRRTAGDYGPTGEPHAQ
jgi:Domain of unknown function (DUF6851)